MKKLCAGGERENGGHVLKDTTSRGLCGRDAMMPQPFGVWPPLVRLE